jgi:hypothetical protein
MSKRTSGILGSTERKARKPRHPDLERWAISVAGLATVLIGFWGPPVAWWLLRLHAAAEHYVQAHLRPFSLLRQGLAYGAWFFVGLTVLGLVWALVTAALRHRRVGRIHGQYLQLLIPRPQGGREGTRRSNREAPFLFWDRLIATLQTTRHGTVPPYLAAELWGDESGQVQWGMWLPAHVGAHRDAVRRLLTAERPQARLVEMPDPLRHALDKRPDDPADPGTRWYAGAHLTLHARDYYPLLEDTLSQRSLVAALRPPRAVLASGASVIVTPAPAGWAERVHQLVQRWRWVSRYERRFDERYKQETDEISLKAQQAHARVSLRVHVVAQTRDAALRECRSLVTTLTTSRKRYAHARQYWQARWMTVRAVHGARLPGSGRARAPFRPLPRLIGMFPVV